VAGSTYGAQAPSLLRRGQGCSHSKTVRMDTPEFSLPTVAGDRMVSAVMRAVATTCSRPLVPDLACTTAEGSAAAVISRIEPGGVASGILAQLHVQS